LTETQRELQQLARKFTKEEIIPKAAEHDRTMEFPWEILKKAHGLGILHTTVPEKYGLITNILIYLNALNICTYY